MRSFQVKRRGAYPSRYSKRSKYGGKSRGRARGRRRSGGGVAASLTRDSSTKVFRSLGGRRRKAFSRFKRRVEKVEQSSFPRTNVVMSYVNNAWSSVAGTQTIIPTAQVTSNSPPNLAAGGLLVAPTLFSGFATQVGARDMMQIEAYATQGAGLGDPSFWIHSGHCEVQFANANTSLSAYLELWEFICIKDISWNGTATTLVGTSAQQANSVNSYDSLGTLAVAGFNDGDLGAFISGVDYSKQYGFDFLQNYKWMQYFKLVKKSRVYLPNIGDGMGDGNVTYEMGSKKSVKYTDEKFGGKLAVAGYTKVLGICLYGCPGSGTGAPSQTDITVNWVNHYVISGPNVGIYPNGGAPGVGSFGNRPMRVPS